VEALRAEFYVLTGIAVLGKVNGKPGKQRAIEKVDFVWGK